MTKEEFSRMLSGKLNISKPNAIATVEAFMATVAEAVAKGERIDLRGFGSFQPITRKAKTVRSGPGLSKVAHLPARTVVRFKPSEALNQYVRNAEKIVALAEQESKQATARHPLF